MQFLRGELAPVLDDYVRWAATGWAAAEQLAPYATTVPSLQIYVAEDDFTGALTEAMKAMQAQEVHNGGRIEFRSGSARLFHLVKRPAELPLASSPRVFADLRSLGGRGEDVAVHFRDEVILPKLRAATRRRPSSELVEWDRACREKLDERIRQELAVAQTVYTAGTWSASYFALGSELSLNDLRAALDTVRGHETGWPPWWVPTREEIRPRVRDDGIECWFKANALREAGHADFWRAEPGVRMFLLRGYQEDEITGEPGAALDLTLPIWRVGESLLHAARMARYVEAREIRFLVHWTGLKGRELRTVAAPDRLLSHGRVSEQDAISTYVQATPDEIDARLPSVVEALVSPLFELFDFFVPPLSLYVDELREMRERSSSS
jgi:transcriptional regulator with XRE-family HTH domain